MIDLLVTHKATLTQVKESKHRKQTKFKSALKPIIQKLETYIKNDGNDELLGSDIFDDFQNLNKINHFIKIFI